METQNLFVYRYSASQNKEVERIRQRYLPQEESKIECLRKLDRRVQSAGARHIVPLRAWVPGVSCPCHKKTTAIAVVFFMTHPYKIDPYRKFF